MIADTNCQDSALDRNADLHCGFRGDETLDRPLSAARWNKNREDSADSGCQQWKCVRCRDCRDLSCHLLADRGLLDQSGNSSIKVIEYYDRPGSSDRLLQGFSETVDVPMKQQT